MFMVNFQLAPRLDGPEAFGEILLTSEGQSIRDSDTYIDSWLSALAVGWMSCAADETKIIDLVDEPTPLVLSRVEERVDIRYGAQSIAVEYGNVAGAVILAALHGLLNDARINSRMLISDVAVMAMRLRQTL